MLTELRITNFALIDQLHLEFPSGFIAFTGETGAGKSLLIDALSLLLGGRASADQIRFSADEALLEVSFLLTPSHPLVHKLQQEGYLLSDQQEIIIRRILSRLGKNRSYVNGQLAPLQIIQDIGQQLVDIHGQHDQQSLLSPKTQLKLLDAFGNLEDDVICYRGRYQEWVEKKAALEVLLQKLGDQANRQDVLQYQYDELVNMQLHSGEEEALNQEYHRLKYCGRLGELTDKAYTTLYEGEEAVLGQLSLIAQWMQDLAHIDLEKQAWLSLLDTATVALREVTDHLRDYRSQMEYDPQRMEFIDTRLAGIQRLKKKYGKSIEELMEFMHVLEQDLLLFRDGERQVAQRRAEVAQQYDSVKVMAQDLSIKRKNVAQRLGQEIKQELAALNMATMDVQINVESANVDHQLTSTGMDRLDILISPNPGEPPMPLGRIASGGELSRMMLAFKTVFADNDQTPVVIFDEIDSGVGGEAGIVMGSRLRLLARFHQVCCITHLPQIASQAHAQFVVEKTSMDNRTLMHVEEVVGGRREVEIARMLGGGSLSPTIRKTAREMLHRGNSPTISRTPHKKEKAGKTSFPKHPRPLDGKPLN